MHTHQGQASAATSQVGNWIPRTDLLLPQNLEVPSPVLCPSGLSSGQLLPPTFNEFPRQAAFAGCMKSLEKELALEWP